MKKILYWVWVVMSVSILVGCSSTDKNVPTEPDEAALYYFNLASAGDFEPFFEGLYFGPEVTQAMAELFKQKAVQAIEAGRGKAPAFVSLFQEAAFELIDLQTTGDEDAVVALRIIRPGKEPIDEEWEMKKVKGVWKLVSPFQIN